MSSPESYRGLMKRAQRCYEESYCCIRGIDSEGFTRLVKWDSIDHAAENLASMKRELTIKIKELNKDSKVKGKYVEMLEKIDSLLCELHEVRKNRKHYF